MKEYETLNLWHLKSSSSLPLGDINSARQTTRQQLSDHLPRQVLQDLQLMSRSKQRTKSWSPTWSVICQVFHGFSSFTNSNFILSSDQRQFKLGSLTSSASHQLDIFVVNMHLSNTFHFNLQYQYAINSKQKENNIKIGLPPKKRLR